MDESGFSAEAMIDMSISGMKRMGMFTKQAKCIGVSEDVYETALRESFKGCLTFAMEDDEKAMSNCMSSGLTKHLDVENVKSCTSR